MIYTSFGAIAERYLVDLHRVWVQPRYVVPDAFKWKTSLAEVLPSLTRL